MKSDADWLEAMAATFIPASAMDRLPLAHIRWFLAGVMVMLAVFILLYPGLAEQEARVGTFYGDF